MNIEPRTSNIECAERISDPRALLRYVGVRFGCPWNCWDFVRHGYALRGISLPESSLEARRLFREISRDARAQAWDLAYFVTPEPASRVPTVSIVPTVPTVGTERRQSRAVELLEPFESPSAAALASIGRRHVGIMIDHRYFVHCSKASGGVAQSDLEKYRFTLRCFLRLRSSKFTGTKP